MHIIKTITIYRNKNIVNIFFFCKIISTYLLGEPKEISWYQTLVLKNLKSPAQEET